jgi:hypothetical protein
VGSDCVFREESVGSDFIIRKGPVGSENSSKGGEALPSIVDVLPSTMDTTTNVYRVSLYEDILDDMHILTK